jgi:ribosomal protein S12 methylthiotransferase
LTGFHVITLGCPKNQVDSEVLEAVCRSAGLRFRKNPDRADLVILNTCAFIAPAVEESLERLGDVLAWKASGIGRKVVLAGCLPGRFPDDGSGGLEDIDLVIKPGEAPRLARWLGASLASPLQEGRGVSRFVKIAEGCGNNCSYCTIPMIRGPFRPADSREIEKSVEQVVGQGAREVGLVAQDSGSHPDLTAILDRVTSSHPDVWFRLYYLHPAHFPRGILKLLENRRNLAPYVDLPIQHASGRVLERMGRGYGPGRIIRIMEDLEGLSREVAVRFTVITGYPGETAGDFSALESFLGRWRSLRHIAAFPWWPEEGTREYIRAAAAGDAVPGPEVSRRLAALSSLGECLYQSWTERLAESVFPVLADSPGEGHSCYDSPESDPPAEFTRPVEPGRTYECRLVEGHDGFMVVEPLP